MLIVLKYQTTSSWVLAITCINQHLLVYNYTLDLYAKLPKKKAFDNFGDKILQVQVSFESVVNFVHKGLVGLGPWRSSKYKSLPFSLFC